MCHIIDYKRGAEVCRERPFAEPCLRKIPLQSSRIYAAVIKGYARSVMLQPGRPAPGFELPDADLNVVSLKNFRDRNVVLYFYPRDDTPGCTMEAIDFSDREDEFSKLKTVVLGVSMDDCVSHGAFRDKHGLAVQLLSDMEGEVCGSYGVLREKEHEGRKKMCIQRTTFIIDRAGVVRHALYGVSPKGHAAEVLELVKGIE